MQDRPTVADRSGRLSLRTRLTLSVALSVAVVIGVVILAGMRLAERLLDGDLRDTARLTAVAVADDVELRQDVDPEAIEPILHDFMTAAPSVLSIPIFRSDTAAGITPLASTSSSDLIPRALVERAMQMGEPAWDDSNPRMPRVATPFLHSDRTAGAVVVSLSMAPLQKLREGGRLLGAAVMVAALFGITLLMHLLARQLIHQPLDDITRAMARVTDGDLAARATVRRDDEIGLLASRLNEMLAELEDLDRTLNERVEAATGTLRQRNEQLARSYQSVLQLREAVARAEQLAAVGQTMANVAHQIGTPLNLVSGHVQLLLQEAADPTLQRRLRIVEEQVERVTSTVRNLLERVRPDAERHPVDIRAILARLAEAVRPQLAAAGVRLDVGVADALPPVLADDTALELALLNLITNAVDAMPGGGVLSIHASAAESGLRLEIRDTGSGISADLLPKIFDPWVTTKGTRGTGLGLGVTREVVERFGGTITASSRAGEGALFTIELPGSGSDPGRSLPGLGSDPVRVSVA